MPIDAEPPELSAPLPDPGEALATDAAGAELTGAHGHHGPFHTQCENCGTKLDGPWCHKCGQHDFEFHRSFGHVFMEALETIFHFEGKFFRNIVTLLFRPGRLTVDFNAGRRAAQMPPFRLYIFVSFVFFLVVSIGGNSPESGHDDDAPAAPGKRVYTTENWHEAFRDNAAKLTPAEREELARVAQTVSEKAREVAGTLAPEAAPDATVTTTAAPAPAGTAATPAVKEEAAPGTQSGLEEFIDHLSRRLSDPEKRRQLGHWIQAHIPHMMMLCLPLFALYTRVLFRKSGLVYLQHLVVSVHFHTFVYLWVLFTQGWTALAGLPGWGLDGWVAFAGNAWLFVYPVVMLRRIFTGSWPKTVFKAGLLALAYTLTLSFGFLLTAVIAFFLV